MVKKFLALAAVLFLGCASVFASGSVDIECLEETMDFDEYYETFYDLDNASDFFDCDLEECNDYDVIEEFFEIMTENVSGLPEGTVVIVSDDEVIYVYLWGLGAYRTFYID